MREIKFNFIYGVDGETLSYFNKTFTFAQIEDGCHFEELNGHPVGVEILAKRQWTGLKDKTGKDIYEGDIIRTDREIYRIEYIASFMTFCPFTQQHFDFYKNGSNHFKYCMDSGDDEDDEARKRHFLFQFDPYEIKVIGNIHENPELLNDA